MVLIIGISQHCSVKLLLVENNAFLALVAVLQNFFRSGVPFLVCDGVGFDPLFFFFRLPVFPLN